MCGQSLTQNGFTWTQEQTLILETKLAKKSGQRFAIVDALLEDLKNN